MSAIDDVEWKRAGTDRLDYLTDARRRRVLAHLLDRSGWASERELAALLADGEHSPAGDGETEAVHTALRHAHLPHLAAADLVEWDRSEGRVRAVADPALADPQFRALATADGDGWGEVLACIADEECRAVLAVLENQTGAVSTDELPRTVAAQSGDCDRSADRVRVRLYHVVLPKLDDAGLVDYDPEEGAVTYRGHPDLPRMDAL